MKNLPIVTLEPKVHKGRQQLCIRFAYRKDFIALVKSFKEARWSRTLQSWYVPYSFPMFEKVCKRFIGLAEVNTKFLPQEFSKKVNDLLTQKKRVHQFKTYLKGKRYSESTFTTYAYLIKDFLSFYASKDLEELNNRSVEHYIETVFLQRNYSISTQRQFISALKLFVTFYPQTNIDSVQLSRPKKSKILPTVLSQEEVLKIIQVTKNLKHRVIIALLYSSGLRIGELIRLKLKDIDLERMQIKIVKGKGRKDRFVGLAKSFLPLLHNYLNTYLPKEFLVEGQNGGMYSESSIRKFLMKSTRHAGIRKKVTAHTFRHSYATHLLENGVALRHIQELLGHAKPETTMIYTHVKQKSLLGVQSPLDTILLSLENKNKHDPKLRLSGYDPLI
jgi:site-specific recombinase XerD